MNWLLHQSRSVYLVITVICVCLLGYGYYLQFAQGLEPCPLCIFQRFAFIGVLLFCFIGFLHGPHKTGRRIYSGLASISAIIGASIAGRQVWLQHLPADQVPECGPDLYFMLEVFPLLETVEMVFKGSGECAEIDWVFLSLSIAEWSMACFVLLFIALVTHTVKK